MRVARENNDILFEPTSLTEDYESGIRIHALGFRQKFCALRRVGHDYLATREYFPRHFKAAVRQRTRWVMGLCLQSWERNHWKGSLLTKYWLWRDRKGLFTNPLGLLTNCLFLVGITLWCISKVVHQPWPLEIQSPAVVSLCAATLLLQCFRLAVRMECVRRVFGFKFALMVPIRSFHENLINGLATTAAIGRYARERRKGTSLAWLKTDHIYPNQESRSIRHRRLDEILVASGCLTESKLEAIQMRVPTGVALSDYLVHTKTISEEELSEVQGLKDGVPSIFLDPREISPDIARVLPARVEAVSKVIPFRIDRGRLLVAGPRAPASTELKALRRFTNLEIEFHLVTWRNFEELRALVA
jgi:adsorption protein B